MKKYFNLISLLLAVVAVGCGSQKAEEKEIEVNCADTAVIEQTVPVVQEVAQAAEVLTVPANTDSVLATPAVDEEAQKYASKINKLLKKMKEGYDYYENAQYGETACTGINMVYNVQVKLKKFLKYMTDEQKAEYNRYKMDGPCDEDAYD